MYEGDTIAAVATPAGRGAIGIVRVSGPGAIAIARRVVRSRQEPEHWQSHRLYRGEFLEPSGRVLDRGLAVLMRGPNSFTGEDVLELHAHGSPVVLQHLLAHVLQAGARHAEPGEFTRRAFLNGKLDLAQAEALADLIEARTLGSALAAARQLGGELSRTLQRLREEVVQALALVEAQLDFGDEIELPVAETLDALDRVRNDLVRLHATYSGGALLRQGARVALVGRPNVGKSSLLNALLGSERAIVTEIPGTTRDTLEEICDCEGIPVVLVDTAGLRPEIGTDAVERIGMQRTKDAVECADLCLLVVDRSVPLAEEDFLAWQQVSARPHLIVANKSDLVPALNECALPRSEWTRGVLAVSAREGLGLLELRKKIAEALGGAPTSEARTAILTHPRHAAALRRAIDAVDQSLAALQEGMPLDIVSVELHTAADALRAVTGEVGAEDILDQIFSRFCIGK
jgi:tRNA modification GTPase